VLERHPPPCSALPADSPLGRDATRVLRYAVLLLSAVVALAWLVTVVVHAADRYGVGHGPGVWIALGDAALDGTLYPPLYEDGYVGGTRWMPAPILLQAALDRVTGDPLLAQRLAAVFIAVPLYGLGYFVLRRFGVDRVLAVGLLACVLATPAGFAASLNVGADQLAVLLQLGALALIVGSGSRRAASAAGALCAVALLAKLTAVWAVAAIALVLLVRERRRIVPFLGTYGVVAAALLGATKRASDGRFTDNVLALGGSGIEGIGTGRVFLMAQDYDQAIWLLVPLAVLVLIRALAARHVDVFHAAWFAAFAVLVITFADIGAWFNHTLDLAFLTVLLAGRITVESGSASAALRTVAALTITIGLAAALLTPTDEFSARAALLSVARGETASDFSARPLEGVVSQRETLLAEDPGLPISLGRRPVVLDPFMLARLEGERPEVVEALTRRVERREFDVVVLENTLAVSRFWYTEVHLGPTVSTAICRAYRRVGTVAGQVLYTPRPRNLASATLSTCFVQ
jgi:hypothetical protein